MSKKHGLREKQEVPIAIQIPFGIVSDLSSSAIGLSVTYWLLMPTAGILPRGHIIVYATVFFASQYICLTGRGDCSPSPNMTLSVLLLAAHPVLSLTVASLLGAVLWNVLSYVRMRVALLAVSKIPGPSSESFWSGKTILPST